MNIRKIFKKVKQYQNLCGLGQYELSIVTDAPELEHGETEAQITLDIWSKKGCIALSSHLCKKKQVEIESVILHEIVHGRILLMKLILEEELKSISYRLEEDMVNDIVNFIEKVKT